MQPTYIVQTIPPHPAMRRATAFARNYADVMFEALRAHYQVCKRASVLDRKIAWTTRQDVLDAIDALDTADAVTVQCAGGYTLHVECVR